MHPYEGLADRHFWARAVAKGFDPGRVVTVPFPLLKTAQKVMSAESCFAATLVPYLERSEIVQDLNDFVGAIRTVNADVRIILTVSPVSIIATATRRYVLAANSYTKSAWRGAAEEAVNGNENVVYFPFYEIVSPVRRRRETSSRRTEGMCRQKLLSW